MATDNQNELHVGTYNVWLMPSIVTFFAHRVGIDISPSKITRAQKIAEVIPAKLDVLVLCEAFCTRSTDLLCKLLQDRHGLAHRTEPLGEKATRGWCKRKLLSGGVVIACRYPLEIVEEYRYGSICARDDALADKGFVYVRFRTSSGLIVHMFATHTQAWDEVKCVDARADQLRMLRKIISEKNISSDEALLVVGDINVSRCSQEYDWMLQELDCNNPNKNDLSNPSFNHVTNKLAY